MVFLYGGKLLRFRYKRMMRRAHEWMWEKKKCLKYLNIDLFDAF